MVRPLSANEVDPYPLGDSLTPATTHVSRELESVCRTLASQTRLRLGSDCAVIVRPPFVLAGDLSEVELQRWYRRTILPATRAMQNEYFTHAPTAPLQLLLFRSADSYNAYSGKLFGDRHVSVYGYYKPQQRAAIVNIATGSGSLVHELTHALMASDFPQAPPWLQEGLASLHEQAGFSLEGNQWMLRGRLNWRLARLQNSIANGKLTPIEGLLTAETLRDANESLNYARARYLCLYLQERGQLANFYAGFREQAASDPTGRETLKEVLGLTDFDSLNRDFALWVARLSPKDR